MTAVQGRARIQILLVEDNTGDVNLVRESFADNESVTLHVAEDGIKALAFLRRETEYRNAPSPDLILLDLNLPKKDGRQVLREIKSDEALKQIPVVVLTSSRASTDIIAAYRLHSNSYISKPADFDEFMEVMGSVFRYWFKTSELPSPAS